MESSSFLWFTCDYSRTHLVSYDFNQILAEFRYIFYFVAYDSINNNAVFNIFSSVCTLCLQSVGAAFLSYQQPNGTINLCTNYLFPRSSTFNSVVCEVGLSGGSRPASADESFPPSVEESFIHIRILPRT